MRVSKFAESVRPIVARQFPPRMTESGRTFWASESPPPDKKSGWRGPQPTTPCAQMEPTRPQRPPRGVCRLRRERAATTTTARGLRVLEDKPGLHQGLQIVESGVVQVEVALRVDKQASAVLLKHLVAAARLRVQAHCVGQSGTAATLHADAEPAGLRGHTLLRHQFANFARGFFRQMDHKLIRCDASLAASSEDAPRLGSKPVWSPAAI